MLNKNNHLSQLTAHSMSPEAAMFTPKAIVPWKGGDNHSSQHINVNTLFPSSRILVDILQPSSASPYDLIMSESIASLINEVTQLRVCCEDLQSSNTYLSERISGLECRLYDEDQGERAPLTKANLTGYASLEDSTEGVSFFLLHAVSDTH